MSMKYIVTTTIYPPTYATRKYAAMEGWNLIVVADKKTPVELYEDIDCYVLDCNLQSAKWPHLSELIGWNTPERKNFGILFALEKGADIIAIVDDDNIPLDNWGKNIIVGKPTMMVSYESEGICFDPYYYAGRPDLWHRGFPLDLLGTRKNWTPYISDITVDVQSGLIDGDPDVDAVCRMACEPVCNWHSGFPITSNAFSPFNSQNTIMTREAATNYLMIPGIGRMTDIWASYYLQAQGFKVAYTDSDVYHKRHPHDAIEDLQDELLGYINTTKLLHSLKETPEAIHGFLPLGASLAIIEYKRLIKEIDAKV